MSLGQRRQALHLAIRQIVNDLDPEGLIAFEAPEDEYDPEVSDLVNLVSGGRPVTDRAVEEIWSRWFGLDAADLVQRQDDLHRLAERLRGMRDTG